MAGGLASVAGVGNTSPPTTSGYKFNSFKEIKSHSSILYNERMAILFYMLDMDSINMNMNPTPDSLLKVRSVLLQIYKNIRSLLRMNPFARMKLNLQTKVEGVYTTDVAFDLVEKMFTYCNLHGYTIKQLHIIAMELNKIEMVLKDVLQFFSYFIRPDFKQKPDIMYATSQYKEMADQRTVDELKEIVGKRNKVDWESLGSTRIELKALESKDDEDEFEEDEDFDKESEDDYQDMDE